MKKFLLSLLCLISFMAINAETITFSNTDFSGSSSSYVTTETTSTVSDVTFAYNNFNPKTGQIRGNKAISKNFYFYNTTPINGTITSIKIKTDNGLSRNFIYVTTGNTKLGTLTDGTKVGDSSIATTTVTYNATDGGSFFEIYFKNGATSGTVKLLSIEITYESAGGEVVETVATPVFSLDGGEITADTEISIECATEDATIKYTIDGTEPAENGIIYTAPFTLNEDATVKAIAIKDGYNNSIVASATYTMLVPSEYSYKLATSVEDGGHYIIVGADGENYFAMGTQNSNNRAAIAVSVTDSIIANPTVRVCEFEIQGTEGAWSFYTGNGYLYAASTRSNHLKTQETLDDNGKASIVIDEKTGVATIKFTGANTRNWMRYNPTPNTGQLFSCYASGQNDVYLYQRVGDIPTGIEDTMVDENAPVEYYNLQGVKVANPENGIFIKKQGGRTSKVVL